MKQIKDLCLDCIYFDDGDWECKKEHYLDSFLVTIECEDRVVKSES